MTRAALAVFVVLVAACSREGPRADLSPFGGGFDPTRFDAGPLPALPPNPLDGRPLRFDVPPFYEDKLAEGAVTALEKYLEDEVRIDVSITASRAYSYGELVDALARADVDIAELSPYQYALVHERGIAVTPIAATVAHGASSYGSYLVVKQSSPITGLEDLKGKRIAFVDPLSTSGYLLPAIFLREHGFDLGKDLQVRFVGSHPAAMKAVRDGDVDVAAVSSDLLIGNAGLAGPLVVIAKAGRMPYDIIVARPGLDPAVFAAVQRALFRLSIHDEKGRAALRTFSSVDGFMPVPEHHYDEVIALARKVQALPQQLVPDAPAPVGP
jgi:phosphonate transport system substrate-binding protein